MICFQITSWLLEDMKKQSPLFSSIFQKIIYAGSFYKGTKYGTPNEFDLMLIFKLPIIDFSGLKVRLIFL